MGDRFVDKMREIWYCPPSGVDFNLPKHKVHLNNLYITYHPIQIYNMIRFIIVFVRVTREYRSMVERS
jgi:hypothetical protein